MPKGNTKSQLINNLSAHFPSSDYQLDRELSQILIFLDANDAVVKCVFPEKTSYCITIRNIKFRSVREVKSAACILIGNCLNGAAELT